MRKETTRSQGTANDGRDRQRLDSGRRACQVTTSSLSTGVVRRRTAGRSTFCRPEHVSANWSINTETISTAIGLKFMQQKRSTGTVKKLDDGRASAEGGEQGDRLHISFVATASPSGRRGKTWRQIRKCLTKSWGREAPRSRQQMIMRHKSLSGLVRGLQDCCQLPATGVGQVGSRIKLSSFIFCEGKGPVKEGLALLTSDR
ncbi:hypothetical protein [Paenibacillus maysiensis]|uniref:hypothetical protein n=1 Tax=Paenibacillus maysiensis TaxID=1155954 RepID=UPI0012DCFA1E|nr:hypothetical protein [Paenibacillus maysiensis]